MSDPVISPDGKFMWDGNQWVSLPSQLNSNVQDSIVMGDVNNKVDNSIHNTYSQDTEKTVRNHLHLVAEKMGLDQFEQAEEIYEKAKHIDYELAIELYEGEFRKIFVNKQWSALSSHSMISDIKNLDSSGIKARKFLEDRVSQILELDNEHFQSLSLLTKISLARIGTAWFTAGNSLQRAEQNCNRLLSVKPNNEMALNGLRKIEFMKKFHFFQWVGLTFVGVLFFAIIIF